MPPDSDSNEPSGVGRRSRDSRATSPSPWSWIFDPRSAVLLILALVVGVGGGRRWLQTLHARRLARRLEDPDVRLDEIRAAGQVGRAGLVELFQILTDAPDEARRNAAGQAIASIWASDDLIAEEEQALVRRGFHVQWQARRTYPRTLNRPIPITVRYGIPFLEEPGPGISPAQLEWSHRLIGAGRAALEVFSPWTPGNQELTFSIDPADFLTHGPHRLTLHTRVRTSNSLSSTWELNLPHVAFPFEFDSRLEVAALLASHDDHRAEQFARLIHLEPATLDESQPRFLDLSPSFVLRPPPRLRVRHPLPSDLAHRVELEFEGLEGRFGAGSAVALGEERGPVGTDETTSIDLAEPTDPLTDSMLRPGEQRLRAHLVPDPALGWTHPAVRSIWPGTLATDWISVQILRR